MEYCIAVVGLGYVGLPLAIEFSKKYKTFGFDVDPYRIRDLINGRDRTLELDDQELINTTCHFTSNLEEIRSANFYVVSVPTPVDKYNKPDLSLLLNASESVGKVLSRGDIVVFESTVYPGATEEDCVPVLEKSSGLQYNKDFYCGYSPERINPGDKEHTISRIVKITSGSTPETALVIDTIYNSIISAGTYRAPSIKVAEAAKVIENAQRDINIAFVNELAILFNKMGINTRDVLDAAGTKWNFLPFKPGLVGGHCIGVDPYYLTFKAQEYGYHPEIILAGRRLNDYMGIYVAGQLIKLMIKKGHRIEKSNVLVLGITYKENCTDIRNTRIIDIIKELNEYCCCVDVYDPWADKDEVNKIYGIDIITTEAELRNDGYDGIIGAVAHDAFRNMNFQVLKRNNTVVYDIKEICGNLADESL